MLEEGTKNFTTEEISLKLDELGSSISFNSGSRSTSIFVSCLVDNIDATLEILEEKLFRPGFRTDDFKRVKKAYRESINNDKKSPNRMARIAFNQMMYGEKNVRGISPSVKSVDKLKLSDVESFYKKQYLRSIFSFRSY